MSLRCWESQTLRHSEAAAVCTPGPMVPGLDTASGCYRKMVGCMLFIFTALSSEEYYWGWKSWIRLHLVNQKVVLLQHGAAVCGLVSRGVNGTSQNFAIPLLNRHLNILSRHEIGMLGCKDLWEVGSRGLLRALRNFAKSVDTSTGEWWVLTTQLYRFIIVFYGFRCLFSMLNVCTFDFVFEKLNSYIS